MQKKGNMHAFILAGGKSSRMGTEKGLVSVNGLPMVSHIINCLMQVTDEITIISGNEAYQKFGFPFIADIIKDKGPMGGIYTGLMNSKHELNLFVSCDVPFINMNLINVLHRNINIHDDIIVPVHKQQPEPLIGIYRKKCADKLMELIMSDQLSVIKALQHFNTNYLDTRSIEGFDENSLSNINTQEDRKNAEEAVQWKN